MIIYWTVKQVEVEDTLEILVIYSTLRQVYDLEFQVLQVLLSQGQGCLLLNTVDVVDIFYQILDLVQDLPRFQLIPMFQ